MKSTGLALALMACIVSSAFFASEASAAEHGPQVGDATRIVMVRESKQQGDNGSSGTSHDRDTIIERVIAVSNAGVTLEFDLPDEASAEDRASAWQYPFRVLKTPGGSIQLLDRAALNARVDKWLKAANWTRDVCGHWIFTWNAFQIECDPEMVLKIAEAFDLPQKVGEGVIYRDKNARGTGTIRRTANSPHGATFAVDLEVDPDTVRRARAESDVVVGEIMRKPVTLGDALEKRSKESISGTISIVFETTLDGQVHRRTKVSKVQTKFPDGHIKTETATQTLERRPVARTDSATTT